LEHATASPTTTSCDGSLSKALQFRQAPDGQGRALIGYIALPKHDWRVTIDLCWVWIINRPCRGAEEGDDVS
jgi:hypothetical protein